MADWWYNLRTGEVEQGAQSSWRHLLGPYSSYAQATQAMDRVKENNARWDEEDEDDDDGLLSPGEQH